MKVNRMAALAAVLSLAFILVTYLLRETSADLEPEVSDIDGDMENKAICSSEPDSLMPVAEPTSDIVTKATNDDLEKKPDAVAGENTEEPDYGRHMVPGMTLLDLSVSTPVEHFRRCLEAVDTVEGLGIGIGQFLTPEMIDVINEVGNVEHLSLFAYYLTSEETINSLHKLRGLKGISMSLGGVRGFTPKTPTTKELNYKILEGLISNSELTSFSFSAESDIDDRVLEIISKSTSINTLYLKNSSDTDWVDTITRRGLVHLGRMSQLKHLTIQNFFTGREGQKNVRYMYEMLEGLSSLETLTMVNINMKDNHAIDCIPSFRRLKEIDIRGAIHITDEFYSNIDSTWALEEFLTSRSIHDKGLAAVSELPNLKYLLVSDSKMTDSGLDQLSKLPNLEHLILKQVNSITLEAVERLLANTSLKKIYVDSPMYKELEKRHPDIFISPVDLPYEP